MPEALTDAERRMSAQYLKQLARLRRQAAKLIAAEWDLIENPTRDAIPAFVDRITPKLRALEQKTGVITRGFISRLTEEVVDQALERADFADLATVPFVEYEALVKSGATVEQARAEGRRLATKLGVNAVQDAERSAGAQFKTETRYRRVPAGPTCRFCMILASNTYRSHKTASVGHGKKNQACDCAVVPIVPGRDPYEGLEQRTYAQLRDAEKDARKSGDSKPPTYAVGTSGNAITIAKPDRIGDTPTE